MKLNLTRDGIIAALTPRRPSINITPALLDFAGQDARTIAAVGHVGSAFERAAYAGSMSAAMLNPDDFEIVKRFVAHLNGEFAIAGVARRDTAVDEQFSPDERDFRDRERL